ncbi:SMC-Scp complex subunit ScpB [Legionella waltersii]|uniref:Segregation and condensation protein B n=1 Tax=Legionella waltersii TaxID=66969 RepID=A0A0W1ALM2_9GAMM|nr:SMC-Scp complex subunit ScpB [Legionella waltersii]KTD82250.1 segregation and condensation protein B [Legionella waltersii]SNV04485.1 segregation and condensation protein B [Legionella waltersii]
MDNNELKNIVEALLLTSSESLTLDKIQAIFDDWQKPTLEQLNEVLLELSNDYVSRSIELIQVASGYRIQTKSMYSPWVARLQMEKPAKYSRAFLETLAIIAYKQPVTRADIEEIRGVAVNSQIIRSLMEREWIKVAGHKDVPGKPAVYATTKEFLNYFNLNCLAELPTLPEVMDSLIGHQVNQINEEYSHNE